jgi:hypothetical protein
MPKFKIVFENNELKSCRPTTRFIGDKELNLEVDYYIIKKNNRVEFLIGVLEKAEALNFANDYFKKHEVLREKTSGTIIFGGRIKKS